MNFLKSPILIRKPQEPVDFKVILSSLLEELLTRIQGTENWQSDNSCWAWTEKNIQQMLVVESSVLMCLFLQVREGIMKKQSIWTYLDITEVSVPWCWPVMGFLPRPKVLPFRFLHPLCCCKKLAWDWKRFAWWCQLLDFFFVIFGATHTYQMPSRIVFKMGAASLLPLSLYISLYVNYYLSHNMRTCIFNVRKADLNQQHVGTETADGQCPYVDPKDPTTSSSTSGTSTVTSSSTTTSATTSTISTASVSITTTGTSATQSTTTSTAFTSTAAATATTATTASTSTITETITTATVTTITATGSISSSTREHGSSSQENLNTTTETMTTSSSLVWLSNQMGQIFKSMKLESLGRSNEWQQLDHHLSFFMQQKARAGFCIDRGRNQT